MKPPFPKIKIGQSGDYRGHTLTRISSRLYTSTHNTRLRYARKELETILDPAPIRLAYRSTGC